jgi:hypothetical protein
MKWEHRNRAFKFEHLNELDDLMAEMGDKGWEAVNFHYKVLSEDNDKPYYFLVMFKRMVPLELTGDID